MGYHFFGKRNRRTQRDGGSDGTTEFAATEATLPPAARDSALADVDIDILDNTLPSASMDSRVMDSQVMDSQIMDSLIDSQVDSQVDSQLLDSPTSDPGLAADAAGRRQAETDMVTQAQPTLSHVGRYALKSPLGQGGLGQVHEAWDPLLSRTVAVKTLQFDLPAPLRESLDGMILNEARAAASLSHAYIVTVFDAGLSAHGVYIAMERLQGRDMRQALASGWAPSPRRAALLVRRVADALAYAHGRGVVHCDIKPANIFLVGRDRPKVLDFGIARIAHGTAVPALDGSAAGSPHYQAPEQIRGHTVDARADLHALGAVLYELLTGRKAFGGDSVEQIQTAVLTLHPAPAHEVRPGVPEALSEIAARAMARDPADRFTSALEMATTLRFWAETEARAAAAGKAKAPAGGSAGSGRSGGSAQPDGPSRRITAARLARLRPMLLLGGLLAAAGLGVGLLQRRPQAAGVGVGVAGAEAGASAVAPMGVTAATAAPVPSAPIAPISPISPIAPASGAAADAASAGLAPFEVILEPAGPAPSAPAASSLPVVDAGARPGVNPARPRPVVPKAAVPAPATRPASATGTVQLAISPWGRVEVDGSPAGTTPPLTRLTLNEGAHTITVRNEDFPPYVVTVRVDADRPATLRHRFGP